MPYFHVCSSISFSSSYSSFPKPQPNPTQLTTSQVWFHPDGGLGHIVEDEARWPRGDLFARETLGGMLDVGPDIVRRQGRWTRGADGKRVEAFRKAWRKWDWTGVLAEEGR